MLSPAGTSRDHLTPPLLTAGSDTYAALQRFAEKVPDPYDGSRSTMSNPLTGGPTFPTLHCRMQMFRPKEKTQSHRHRSTSIYHVFRGSGTTTINGDTVALGEGRQLRRAAVELAQHANHSAKDEAILFSMHDTPVLQAFGLELEEGVES